MRLPKSKALYVSVALVGLFGATAATVRTAQEVEGVHDNGQRKADRGYIGNPSILAGGTDSSRNHWIAEASAPPPTQAPAPTGTDTPLSVIQTKTQEIPFQTIRRNTDRLYQGQQRVLTYGVKGSLQIQTSSVYQGHAVIRHTVSRQVVRDAVNEVIEVGTAERPKVLSGRGDSSIIALKSLTVLATAYVGGGQTATGMAAEPGVIAVDPRVIPLGTKVYIPGIGVVRAEDTGGAIVGDHIDICMSSQVQADAWGVRTLKIYEIQ